MDEAGLFPAFVMAAAGVLLIVVGRLLQSVDDNLADFGGDE
jgi:hypothetical protein